MNADEHVITDSLQEVKRPETSEQTEDALNSDEPVITDSPQNVEAPEPLEETEDTLNLDGSGIIDLPQDIGAEDTVDAPYDRQEREVSDFGEQSSTASSSSDDPSLRDRLDVAESTLPTTVSGQVDQFKEEHENTQTIFTDNQSLHLPEAARTRLITTFAGELLESATRVPGFQDESVNRIADYLPELLKEYAQELSQTAQPGIQRDATTFVRHYRK